MTVSKPQDDVSEDVRRLTRFHMRFGWLSLLLFVTMGTLLESLLAFKVSLYMDVGTETRRLVWTLAHAHGVGLSLVHILFGATVSTMFQAVGKPLRFASLCLVWSTVLIPLGFLLGGFGTYGGDPGIGIFLVPIGALPLWVGVFLVARDVKRA